MCVLTASHHKVRTRGEVGGTRLLWTDGPNGTGRTEWDGTDRMGRDGQAEWNEWNEQDGESVSSIFGGKHLELA